ncbi:3-dehydroquinate synthase [Mucilaginibacter pallidiroseus]|uniref:3-dehydroquinate synthase n=1 Tax=Mucilaginibacter pallidiroseus TaxID=2599295 RepID=A0A563UC26_9SPHI|nr:3-dehydroquinate synthase [Mucilaginibacter pallidiroseus]TWR28880.1 3-dehydroquinate synthase [Mucilaginibacter pallidiroseus]
MNQLSQSFTIKYEYQVFFTENLFDLSNTLLNDFLLIQKKPSAPVSKILFVLDKGVVEKNATLVKQIESYFKQYNTVDLVPHFLIVPGGEIVKIDEIYVNQVLKAVDTFSIDRHSYIAALGGGALLDMVGYAAAIAHRGIKHIRIPSTVLSQNDSGIGVKNGVNYFSKKNFLGTFSPPAAVFNDEIFLKTLSDRDWLSGIAEAVKVALLKDSAFFEWIEAHSILLAKRDMPAMKYLIWKCAALHLEHIGGADPFESGSSRPLDFGHWSAHKLEYLSNFEMRHGEAVAIGIALDTIYSNVSGRLSTAETERIITTLQTLGFQLTHKMLFISNEQSPLVAGLMEFREHLGGLLTITLLNGIGCGEEVHEIDISMLSISAERLNLIEERKLY